VLIIVVRLVLVLLAIVVLVVDDTVPMVLILKAETNNNEDDVDEGMIPTSKCSTKAEMSIRSLVDDDDMVTSNHRIEDYNPNPIVSAASAASALFVVQ